MTGFDWIVVAVVALSALLGLLRGIIKEVIALAAWIVGLVAAILFTERTGDLLPEMLGVSYARYVVAFVAILVGVLVLGALVAWVLRSGIKAVGLSFLDRGLGVGFGIGRGIVIVLAFMLIVGATGLAQRDWWQNSLLAPWLVEGALALKGHLPPAWAERLDAWLGTGLTGRTN